ncbi:MAG: 23S ribosomal RNA methyltransferase Erm [Balneolaceae bacterium]
MQSNIFGQQPVRLTGQHFTTSTSLIHSMINEAAITQHDLVLDIGAGKGAITLPLAKKANRVVAIERDPELASQLKASPINRANVNILNMDIREMPLPKRPFKVVANIPYGITTHIFGKLMDKPNPNFQGGTIIVEWGAALKFTKASQASPRMVGWNTLFEMTIIQKVSRQAFHPPPTVDSALVKIEKKKHSVIPSEHYQGYLSFVASMLSPHGVYVKKALRKVFTKTQVKRMMKDAEISNQALIQDLDVSQWAYCYQTMQKLIPEPKHPVMPDTFKN